MNKYEELVPVPPGIRIHVSFHESECYGISTGKCSLTGWSMNLNEQYTGTLGENHIGYCRQLAKNILIYDCLVRNYGHHLPKNVLVLEQAIDISNILKMVGYPNYKDVKDFILNDRVFIELTHMDLRKFISGWEEDTSIRASLCSCGHFWFSDGRHRSCIADRLGVSIKMKLSRYEDTCNHCYHGNKNNQSFLSKILKRLNKHTEIPL